MEEQGMYFWTFVVALITVFTVYHNVLEGTNTGKRNDVGTKFSNEDNAESPLNEFDLCHSEIKEFHECTKKVVETKICLGLIKSSSLQGSSPMSNQIESNDYQSQIARNKRNVKDNDEEETRKGRQDSGNDKKEEEDDEEEPENEDEDSTDDGSDKTKDNKDEEPTEDRTKRRDTNGADEGAKRKKKVEEKESYHATKFSPRSKSDGGSGWNQEDIDREKKTKETEPPSDDTPPSEVNTNTDDENSKQEENTKGADEAIKGQKKVEEQESYHATKFSPKSKSDGGSGWNQEDIDREKKMKETEPPSDDTPPSEVNKNTDDENSKQEENTKGADEATKGKKKVEEQESYHATKFSPRSKSDGDSGWNQEDIDKEKQTKETETNSDDTTPPKVNKDKDDENGTKDETGSGSTDGDNKSSPDNSDMPVYSLRSKKVKSTEENSDMPVYSLRSRNNRSSDSGQTKQPKGKETRLGHYTMTQTSKNTTHFKPGPGTTTNDKIGDQTQLGHYTVTKVAENTYHFKPGPQKTCDDLDELTEKCRRLKVIMDDCLEEKKKTVEQPRKSYWGTISEAVSNKKFDNNQSTPESQETWSSSIKNYIPSLKKLVFYSSPFVITQLITMIFSAYN